MKKLLSCLLVLVLLLSATPVAFSVNAETATSGTTGDCTWTLDGTVLTISGYGKMGDYVVTTIQASPWGNNLTEVIIESGVTSIGEYAFRYCAGLTSITIPNSVTSIGDHAFSVCTGLTSITIPDSVTSIGNSAFSSCKGLTSITIPDSVTSIGEYAFWSCTGLTSITIPDSVTSIGNSAFYDCMRLTSITIPNSVTSIGSSAFEGCSGLTSITIPNSVTSIGERTFYGCKGLTNITIPNGVTSIGDYAFEDCTGLTSITPPNGVISIGWSAFKGCTELTSITIPNSVTSIGGDAFYGTGYYNDEKNWEENALYIDDCLIKAKVVAVEYTVKEHCRIIAGSAFSGYFGPTSITIPNSVTSIGEFAFSRCWGLRSVTIPDSVTSIGNFVFYDCKRLTSITIPNSVTSIGDSAFSGCTGLTSITIPNSVTSIGERTFYGCKGLTSITIPKSVTSITGNAFDNCPNLCIRTPENSYAHQYATKNNIRYYLTEMSGIAAVPVVADSRKAADGKLEVTLKATDGYEYRCDDGAWQSSPVFGGLAFGVQHRFCQRLAATEQHVAGNASDPLLVMLKDKGRTPEKPIIESKTADSITVAKTEGFEYSLDGQNWQKSHVFKGLEPNKTYTVYQRVAETDTTYASESSTALTVQLDPPFTRGDLDGDEEISDWDGVLLARYLAGWNVNISNADALDIDGDGEITDWDGVLLDRYLAGWDIKIS